MLNAKVDLGRHDGLVNSKRWPLICVPWHSLLAIGLLGHLLHRLAYWATTPDAELFTPTGKN